MKAEEREAAYLRHRLIGVDETAEEIGLKSSKRQTLQEQKHEMLRDRLVQEIKDTLHRNGVVFEDPEKKVQNVFSNSLMRSYAPGVFEVMAGDRKMKSEESEQTDAKIAEQYGLDSGASVARRRRAMKSSVLPSTTEVDKGKESLGLPSFKTIAYMNAAADAEIPERGHEIALKAFVESMEYFAEQGQFDIASPISWQQVLCTCRAFGSKHFWQAVIEKPQSQAWQRERQLAQQDIDRWIRKDLLDANTTFEDVREATYELRYIWPMIWSTLPNGWF